MSLTFSPEILTELASVLHSGKNHDAHRNHGGTNDLGIAATSMRGSGADLWNAVAMEKSVTI